jgi:hypothetical protein
MIDKIKDIESWIIKNKDNKILMKLYNNYIEVIKYWYTENFFYDYDDYEKFEEYDDWEKFEEYLLSHSINEEQDRLLNDRYKKLKTICNRVKC